LDTHVYKLIQRQYTRTCSFPFLTDAVVARRSLTVPSQVQYPVSNTSFLWVLWFPVRWSCGHQVRQTGFLRVLWFPVRWSCGHQVRQTGFLWVLWFPYTPSAHYGIHRC